MSDCGVCVYFDGDPADVFNQTEKRAAKPHECCECSRQIIKGETYQRVKMQIEGEWSTWDTCLVCAEIRAAFSCEGESIGGVFWESMEECFPEMTTGCFDRLKTVAAKQELMRRWNEWKFRQ